MSATSEVAPHLSAAPTGQRSPSPFAVSDQTKPHTSISNLPDLPASVKSTAQRRRRETQELRNKIELLGTKAAASGDIEGLTAILGSISSAGDHDQINIRNEVGYNMLHYAVAYGHVKIVELLIDHGADLDCITEDLMLETPLILAVKYAANAKENQTILDLFLKEEVNVNSQNSNGDTALILATDMQNVAVFEQLIGLRNVEIEKSNLKGDTPLIIAARHDDTEMINMLLAHEADIYTKNKLGHNSVHVACINGNINALRAILGKHSVEHSRILRERDLQGNTPLLLAKMAPSNVSILVEYLISINADTRASDHHGNKLLHLYNKVDDVDLCERIIGKYPHDQSQLLEDVNNNNETPLHIVTKLGYKDTAKLFIDKGANLFAEDCQGFTPFMVAIETKQKDILRIMLDHNSNVLSASIVQWALENDHVTLLQAIWEQDRQILVDPERLNLPSTLLHVAAKSGAVESTKKLLAILRALLNSKDKKDRFPVHIAAEKGHLKVVISLCEAEAEINIGDHNGNTPLHYACSNGHIQIVKYLIQLNESSLKKRNALEYDAVACAAAEGHCNILQYLLSLGQSPNGTHKACPIILASAKGHIKCVKLLLNHQDIDISITNTVGYNCLGEAIRNGHKELTFAILSSERHWKVAMRMSTADGITPMRLMVEKMPDAAELVLYKSIKFHGKEEHGHSTVSEIGYSYEFIEDFQDPREECYYRLASFFKPVEDNNCNIAMHTLENGASPLSATTMTSNSDTYNTPAPINTHKARSQNNNWGPKKFVKENHVIKLMVDHKRTQLLQHPVVSELLTYKWHIFGFPSFFFQLFIFVIFLAFLTTFALRLPLPDEDFCRRSQFIVGSSNTDLSVMIMDNSTIMDEAENRTIRCPGLTDLEMSNLEGLTTVLLILTIIGVLSELIQLIFQRVDYFLNLHNYMEIVLYIAVLLFIKVDSDTCWCADRITWQIGAAACVLAWLNLVFILKRLPFTAIPINMMINMIGTFISIALLPLLLIFTFALPFYMLLASPEMPTSFQMFPQSCVKTVVMTTGEFEFEEIFFSSTIPYPYTTYALWIVFIIVMPVLFNNLLVGLAVGDIQKERDKAVFIEFNLQVHLALSVEEFFSTSRRFCYKNFDKFHPTKSKPLQMFQKMFSTTFEERLANNSEKLKAVSDENRLPDGDPLDEIKCMIEKQEDEIIKLKAMVQEKSEEQDRLLQKILRSVENPASGASQFQSRSLKFHLKKSQSSNIDDSAFPLLPQ